MRALRIRSNMRELRRYAGLKQFELAKKLEEEFGLGRNQSSISALEKEVATLPKFEVILAYSDFFNIPLDVLVDVDLKDLENNEIGGYLSSNSQTTDNQDSKDRGITSSEALSALFGRGTNYIYKAFEHEEYRRAEYKAFFGTSEQSPIYIYYLPTRSDKTALSEDSINFEVVPYGLMTFENDEGVCKATYFAKIDGNYEESDRHFRGFFVTSKKQRVSHLAFIERGLESRGAHGELFFMSFREHRIKNFQCAVATVISTHSRPEFDDWKHLPTAHRMLLSSVKLEDSFVRRYIWPFLELNSSQVYIKKSTFENLPKNYEGGRGEAKVYHEQITNIKKSTQNDFVEYSIFEFPESADIEKMRSDENRHIVLSFLADLRSSDIGFDVNKVSNKVDTIVGYIFDERKNLEELLSQDLIKRESEAKAFRDAGIDIDEIVAATKLSRRRIESL